MIMVHPRAVILFILGVSAFHISKVSADVASDCCEISGNETCPEGLTPFDTYDYDGNVCSAKTEGIINCPINTDKGIPFCSDYTPTSSAGKMSMNAWLVAAVAAAAAFAGIGSN